MYIETAQGSLQSALHAFGELEELTQLNPACFT